MAIAKAQKIFAGEFDLARALKTFEIAQDTELLDATVLAVTDGIKIMETGLSEANLNLEGLWRYDPISENEIGNFLLAVRQSPTATVITVGVENVLGAAAFLMKAKEASYSLPVKVGELMMTSAEFAGENLFAGNVVFSDTGVVALNSSVSRGSLDNGAASSTGLVWNVHVYDAPGAETLVRLQHSTDGTVFVDLDTASISENGSEQRVIAAGVNINRYLRIQVSPTDETVKTFAAVARL